jgi:hypothetical protein
MICANYVPDSAPAEPDVSRCKCLVAERFVVQGPDDKQVAILTRSGGIPLLAFNSPRDDNSLTLALLPDGGPIIKLDRPQGAGSAVLTIAEDGSPYLKLKHNDSSLVSFRVHGDDECSLDIAEEGSQNAARVAMTKHGPKISLTDKLGKLRLALSSRPEGTVVLLHDQGEVLRSSMHHSPTASSLTFLDRKQATRLDLTRDSLGTRVLLLGPDADEQLLLREVGFIDR